MPTFVLKKYDQPKAEDAAPKPESTETPELESEEAPGKDETTVRISGAISEILAVALNKAFANKNIEMTEVEEREEGEAGEGESKMIEVNSVSTEEINADPFTAIKRISSEQLVLIDSKQKPFSSRNEEWFLTNVHDRSQQVFTTATQFADHVAKLMR